MIAQMTLVRVVAVAALTRSIVPASGELSAVTQEVQGVIDETISAELTEAGDYLNGLGKQCQGEGIEALTQVRQGVGGQELLEAMEEEQIDAAGIATYGRSGTSRTVFGSVADQLIRESGKPVLAIEGKQ
jgi:nucleotide-binding universal stress UspA family protein